MSFDGGQVEFIVSGLGLASLCSLSWRLGCVVHCEAEFTFAGPERGDTDPRAELSPAASRPAALMFVLRHERFVAQLNKLSVDA